MPRCRQTIAMSSLHSCILEVISSTSNGILQIHTLELHAWHWRHLLSELWALTLNDLVRRYIHRCLKLSHIIIDLSTLKYDIWLLFVDWWCLNFLGRKLVNAWWTIMCSIMIRLPLAHNCSVYWLLVPVLEAYHLFAHTFLFMIVEDNLIIILVRVEVFIVFFYTMRNLSGISYAWMIWICLLLAREDTLRWIMLSDLGCITFTWLFLTIRSFHHTHL